MDPKQKSRMITAFLMVWAFENVVNNLAHPVTPVIIQTLQLPDYMFGAAFAAMAVTNFLFSPLWGKLSQTVRMSTLMFWSCMGYAVGQTMFMLAQNMWMVLLARAFSGAFSSGFMTMSMIYVVDNSPNGAQGRNLTFLTTITVVAAAFGYLLGGVLGDISVQICFGVQIAGMVLCAVVYLIMMRKTDKVSRQEMEMRVLIKEANPLSAFVAIRPYMDKTLLTLFASILCTFVAYNAFEQCFNYYMIDQYAFSTTYNGAVKAGTGIVSLIANMTICMAILRKKKINKPVAWLLLGSAAAAIIMLFMPNLALFLMIAMVFFGCTAVFQPLLQEQVASRGKQGESSGVLMGFYNAVKSLGMIFGALTAGFIYDIMPELPFWMAGIFFVLAGLCSLLYGAQRKKSIGEKN